MTQSAVAENVVHSLNDREWDKLITMVLEGCVVPIVGPELLTITDEQGKSGSLYDIWGNALAAQYDMPLPIDDSIPLLYQVTNRRSLEQTGPDLAYDIYDIIKSTPTPIPESLRKLAEIGSFPLYVTTTVDHQLMKAFEQIRAETGSGARQILFRPKGSKDEIDLPEDMGAARDPIVYHLFGAAAPADQSFAKTEDDLIEFSWRLLDPNYSPSRLYEYLRKKTVLLIGCCFPDWLGRFLLHALQAGRQEVLNVYYVGHNIERGLEEFLRRRRGKIHRVSNVTEFVDELHRRWKTHERRRVRGSTPAPKKTENQMKSGAVFLSYAREDKLMVSRVKSQLESANIDTWMDESSLEPGSEYARIIQDNIHQAAFFIAIISRTLNAPDRRGRFLWKEWRWAEDVALERRRDDNFLQPLCVDNTPAGASFVEPPFRNLHWNQLDEKGLLPDEFLQFLIQGIRRYRSAR